MPGVNAARKVVEHDIIVLGASAGGVEALTRLVSLLPADLPAALFVVVHVPAHSTSLLPRIFSRAGKLTAVHPSDNETIRHGRIYVAPPNHHLLVKQGIVHLSRGPKENGHRPAVDPLFRTAALVYGPRVVGVVLSGSLDDGTAGLSAVKSRGGVTVVQSPDEALYGSMPRNAILNVEVDHVLPVASIATVLDKLAHDSSRGEVAVSKPEDMEKEAEIADLEPGALHSEHHPGTPSGFACPDCGGALWELVGDEMIRFRCRVGHAWSAGSLLAEQTDATEMALWTALRALEERVSLSARLVHRMRAGGNARSAEAFEQHANEARRSAEVLRGILLSGKTAGATDPDAPEHGAAPDVGDPSVGPNP
jgi:two-component system chemotaxis response regulator CheB